MDILIVLAQTVRTPVPGPDRDAPVPDRTLENSHSRKATMVLTKVVPVTKGLTGKCLCFFSTLIGKWRVEDSF